MFTRTFTIILSTISSLICILNSNLINAVEFSPLVQRLLNAYSENDCFFIVGPESGPIERIGSFKNILSANSEDLRKLLQYDEGYDILLPDIEPKTFKDFLICLYGDSDIVINKLSFEECGKMLYLTGKFSVTQLRNKLISRLLEFEPSGLDSLNITGLCNENWPRYVPQNDGKHAYLHLYVKDVTRLIEDKWYYSDRVELGNFIWTIMIKKRGNSFLFYVNCSPKDKTNPYWKIRSSLDYILLNQEGGLNEQQSYDFTFDYDGYTWGYDHFIDWSDLIDPNKGFIKNNHILVLTHVNIDV